MLEVVEQRRQAVPQRLALALGDRELAGAPAVLEVAVDRLQRLAVAALARRLELAQPAVEVRRVGGLGRGPRGIVARAAGRRAAAPAGAGACGRRPWPAATCRRARPAPAARRRRPRARPRSRSRRGRPRGARAPRARPRPGAATNARTPPRCWRGAADGAVSAARSSSVPWRSSSAMARHDSIRAQPAASSIASGSPSTWRQMSTIAALSAAAAKSGSTRRAALTNRRTASKDSARSSSSGSGTGRPSSGIDHSPATASRSRDVTRIFRRGAGLQQAIEDGGVLGELLEVVEHQQQLLRRARRRRPASAGRRCPRRRRPRPRGRGEARAAPACRRPRAARRRRRRR